MKQFLCALAVTAAVAAPANAGSLNDPIVENDIAADAAATSSTSGVALVLIMALLLAVAATD